MVTWPRSAVLMSCKNYAPLLPPIDGLDPARLLAALAMNESSLGDDCGPRYEAAWDIGGEYASNPVQAKNLELFPYAAACSYGPWQLMFYNAPGYTPTELNGDLSLVTRATIGYLVRQIQRWKITTVQGIGELWNHGSPVIPPATPSVGVQMYCRDLAGNYIAAEMWLR
jgi:hypothetical protein